MPTSALECLHEDAPLVVAIDIATVRNPQNRIKWAAALSALAHAALFVAFGLAAVETANVSSVPEIVLRIEPKDGRDREHENAPAVARPAVLMRPAPVSTVTPNEELDIAFANNRPPGTENAPTRASSAPEPHQIDKLDQTTVPDEPAADVASSPQDSAVVTTVAENERQAPERIEPAHAQSQEAPIPSSQQAMLTERVLRWTQGLQDTDLTQDHMAWEDDGLHYTAVLKRQPSTDDMGIERDIVEIATEQQGKRLRTQVQMKRLAFSHFTQLVDRWDTEIQLHDDEIAGRFHSNSEILLGYDRKVTPRFLGKVTTAARGFGIASWSSRKRRDEIFPAGLETRVGRIELPEKFVPVSADRPDGNPQVRSFEGDTRITFYPDGTYGWQALHSPSPEERQPIATTPAYFVAARRTTLHVSGTVSGTVLVYSPARIVIDGDLVYAHDPRSDASSKDYVGLVSDNYVEIARPRVTGPGDLEIDAAVYARRRFIVTDENAAGNGTLIIYGSLTAGSLSATEPRYATRVVFDARFEQLRPPGFPMTNRYEIEAWDAHWKDAGATE